MVGRSNKFELKHQLNAPERTEHIRWNGTNKDERKLQLESGSQSPIRLATDTNSSETSKQEHHLDTFHVEGKGVRSGSSE